MDLLLSVSLRAMAPAAIAGLVLGIARVRSAAARHAVWALVTLGMLLSLAMAPILPPVRLLVLPAVASGSAQAITVETVAEPVQSARHGGISWDGVAAIGYGLGVAIGLIRLAFGYGFTRRLARAARHVAGETYESSWISVPMTMGWLRPKVLLPQGWRDWEEARTAAVLAHEREHVRRADWAIAGMAAVNRCVFWFHPLAWWLERTLARLAEQACDDAAILETGRRAHYAEVLLEMASAVKSSRGRVVWEAMAMARAAEVRVRIERILDETRPVSAGLSRRWRAGLLACGLPLVYAAAVLQVGHAVAQEQKEPPGKPAPAAPASEPAKPAPPPVRASKPAPAPAATAEPQAEPLRLIQRVEPEYPRIAKQVGARGTVELDVVVAPDGHVRAAKVLRGHPMLLNAAVEAVKQWVYTAQPRETAIVVSLNFGGEAPQRDGGLIQQAVLISRKEPVYPEEARRSGISGLVTLDATIGTDGRISAVRTVRGDPILAAAAEDAVRQWIYKPTSLNGAPVETQTQITLNFVGDTKSLPDGNVFDKAVLITRREPVDQGIEGTVVFRAKVGLDGRLSNIRATDGPAELVPAALDAVKQWVYRPARFNGQPVEADTQITIRFTPGR